MQHPIIKNKKPEVNPSGFLLNESRSNKSLLNHKSSFGHGAIRHHLQHI